MIQRAVSFGYDSIAGYIQQTIYLGNNFFFPFQDGRLTCPTSEN